MSHFLVLVIGDNVEAQLAPYHEFECSGIIDQYVQDVDVTDKCKEYGLRYYGLENKTVTDESQVDREGEHIWGFAVVDADGNIIKAVNRTNPNKKWDWWVIGGRWCGFLKFKEGGRTNMGIKDVIDFEGMRNEAGQKAAERWDKAAAAHGGTPWKTWVYIRDVECKGNIDDARAAYYSQPQVKAIKDALNAFLDVDQFLASRDEYIQSARDSATAPYAIVKDCQWIAKGEMGWFGMSDDKMVQDDWNKEVNKLIDSLPGDTIITCVDCHI